MSMPAADGVRAFVGGVLNPSLPAAWRIQFGRWVDGAKSDRYAVIKPVGGLPAELVRQPQFTLTLVGAEGEDADVAGSAADAVVEAMRSSSGALVFMQPGEPQYIPTADGRHCFELAVSTITN